MEDPCFKPQWSHLFSFTGIIVTCVRELQMGFHDVEFLSSRACFCPTFLKKCGRGESLWTATCIKTIVGVSKGMLHIKYILFNKSFWGQSFYEDHKMTDQKKIC